MSTTKLIEAAAEVRASAYAPFVAIAVVADSHEPAVPCGGCRQVLAEFNPSVRIITSTISGTTQEFSLTDLLPQPKQGILG